MRQEFLDIVHKLKTNKYYAISVIDESTMRKILTTSLGTTLIEKYGSVENYFENLKTSGLSKFSVIEFTKNGSSFKNTGNIIRNLNFTDKETAVNPVQVITPASNFPALNGLASQQVVGLGFYEAANLMASSQEKIRLEEENKYLKANNEELKKLVDELKEERLKSQYDTAGKENQNNMLLGVIQGLPAILSGFKTSLGSGLNAPTAEQNQQLSIVKLEMIKYISEPTVSDELIQALYGVAVKTKNEIGFYEKLEELLNTH